MRIAELPDGKFFILPDEIELGILAKKRTSSRYNDYDEYYPVIPGERSTGYTHDNPGSLYNETEIEISINQELIT